MTENKHVKETKSRMSNKKNKPKREANIQYWKGVAHHILLFFMVIFSLAAMYFLLYGLILEPNLSRHIYGPGDFRELIYLLVLLFAIGICYLLIKWIHFQAIRFQIWDNLRLLASLGFNLEKYVALKRMGIQYKHRKRKSKRRKSKKSKS